MKINTNHVSGNVTQMAFIISFFSYRSSDFGPMDGVILFTNFFFCVCVRTNFARILPRRFGEYQVANNANWIDKLAQITSEQKPFHELSYQR